MQQESERGAVALPIVPILRQPAPKVIARLVAS